MYTDKIYFFQTNKKRTGKKKNTDESILENKMILNTSRTEKSACQTIV